MNLQDKIARKRKQEKADRLINRLRLKHYEYQDKGLTEWANSLINLCILSKESYRVP